MDEIRAAWAAVLRLPDFPAAGEVRHPLDLDVLTVVRLGAGTVVAGPARLLDAVADTPADQLVDHDVLLARTAASGAGALGAGDLFVLQGAPVEVGAGDAGAVEVVADTGPMSAELEAGCSTADVNEVELSTMTHRWLTLADARPLAGAGYDVWRGRLAHLGVLTHPDHRGRGLGRAVAAVAVGHALDRGLLPQWRSRTDNTASAAVARALGFTHVGTQTSVRCR